MRCDRAQCARRMSGKDGSGCSRLQVPQVLFVRPWKTQTKNSKSSCQKYFGFFAHRSLGHVRCFWSCCNIRNVSNTAGIRNTIDPITHMITAPVTWSVIGEMWNGFGCST